jgi:uncharacterized alpha/beta hydrolase family protein
MGLTNQINPDLGKGALFMRRRFAILTIVVIAVAIGGLAAWHRARAAKQFVQSSVPTIFVHGWGSSANAEAKMTHAAKRAGVTETSVRANVAKSGKVTFNRTIPAHAINPIVEVNLADNKLSAYKHDYVTGYKHGGTYVKNVVLALEKQHHYAAINLVGHSMGNLEIINYINDNVNNDRLPKINHLVAIAGHYNGFVGQKTATSRVDPQTGKPTREDASFKPLLSLRQTFPTNTRVLNIYGDMKDGSHSDGDVPVNSAKTLKYLVAGRARSYREVEIKGKDAQHSKLHNNDQVNRELVNFLWRK